MLAAGNRWVGQTIVFCGLPQQMADDEKRSSAPLGLPQQMADDKKRSFAPLQKGTGR